MNLVARLAGFAYRLTPLRIALAVTLVFGALRLENWRYLHLSDIRAMDYRLLQRGPVDPTGEVVVVAIDDASVRDVGRWPWPRSVMADLLGRIAAAGPKAVGVDVVFSEPSAFRETKEVSARPPGVDEDDWRRTQATLAAQDAALVEVLRAHSNIILGFFFDELHTGGSAAAGVEPAPLPRAAVRHALLQASGAEAGLRPILQAGSYQASIDAFSDATRAMAYFNVNPDPGDGLVRRVPLVIRYGDDAAVPLALATLMVAREAGAPHVRVDRFGVERLSLAGIDIPAAEDGTLVVQYRGPAYTFPYVSAVELLRDARLAETLRDRIVLVGVTAIAVADFRATPFAAVFPGVEIHANVVDNLIRGDFLYQPRWLVAVDLAVLFALALILGVGLRRLRGPIGLVFAAVTLGLYLVASQLAYLRIGLPLSIVYPMIAVFLTYTATVLTQYVTEERERRRLRRVMDLYLSPAMAEHVSAHPERLFLGGEKLELTVFFSDIRGFTSISEKLEPEALVELLNDYLGAMTDIIFDREGMLDKYIGDALMAVWGAPLPQPDHAARACLAALDMVERLGAINAAGRERGWPLLEIGCGINTGPMVFGNMGSERHLALTVMGDNVNLASRLEGANKFYGTQILASAATVAAAGSAVVARELDLLRVKGRSEPVAVYEVLAPAARRDEVAAAVEAFAAGVSAYRERRWQAAEDAFEAALAARPSDNPARLYIARCREHRATPPPADWTPVVVLDSK